MCAENGDKKKELCEEKAAASLLKKRGKGRKILYIKETEKKVRKRRRKKSVGCWFFNPHHSLKYSRPMKNILFHTYIQTLTSLEKALYVDKKCLLIYQ